MLETNRLLIRNFVAEDAHSCFEGWGKDKKLGKYILGYPTEEKQMEAFEALQCIIQEYLVKRDMYMLEAKYNISNMASGNLLKKLGFQFDGELRNRRIDIVSGERKNLVICSITKEDMVIEDIAMDILEIMKERYR